MRKRVTVLREIIYDGPEEWVDQCLSRMINTPMQAGPGRTISGRVLDQRTEIIREMPFRGPHTAGLDNPEAVSKKRKGK